MARHRSVGAEERVAVQPDDEPTASQASCKTGVSEDCYDPSAKVSADEAQKALNADDFCGALVYNTGGPESLKVQSVDETPDVVVPSEDFDDTSNLESDFFAQCGGQTGDFSSKIQFTHNCQVDNCEGDTVLTQYVFEAPANGQFNGGTEVPAFSGLTNATSDFTFDPGVNTWTDVDPLDGNPDRNDDTDSSVQYPVT
jgi:hypothetical protein